MKVAPRGGSTEGGSWETGALGLVWVVTVAAPPAPTFHPCLRHASPRGLSNLLELSCRKFLYLGSYWLLLKTEPQAKGGLLQLCSGFSFVRTLQIHLSSDFSATALVHARSKRSRSCPVALRLVREAAQKAAEEALAELSVEKALGASSGKQA